MNMPRLSVSTRGAITSTPGILSGVKSNGIVVEEVEQVAAVAAGHGRSELAHVVGTDVTHSIGDFFERRDHEALPLFDALHEVARMEQCFVSTCIEPRDSAPETFDVQLAALEIGAIDVGEFELAARRRLQRASDVDHLIVIKVQTCHRPWRWRDRGFFNDIHGAP